MLTTWMPVVLVSPCAVSSSDDGISAPDGVSEPDCDEPSAPEEPSTSPTA